MRFTHRPATSTACRRPATAYLRTGPGVQSGIGQVETRKVQAQTGTTGIGPHRSYRRLTALNWRSAGLTAALLMAIEVVLATRLDDLSRLFSDIALSLTSGAGTDLSLSSQSYLGSTIHPITFSLQPMDYTAVWTWFVCSLVGSWLLFRVRALNPPLRLIGCFGLAVVAASALYLLFFGHLGYEGEAFSILYVRTNALVWLLAPMVMGALSLTLPFTSIERLGFVSLCVACLFALSSVRYAVFIWVLSEFGALFMPALYLFLGPLLDFVYLMSIFALFLAPLGRRLDRAGRKAVWTWL
jgi:hypothetical protein